MSRSIYLSDLLSHFCHNVQQGDQKAIPTGYDLHLLLIMILVPLYAFSDVVALCSVYLSELHLFLLIMVNVLYVVLQLQPVRRTRKPTKRKVNSVNVCTTYNPRHACTVPVAFEHSQHYA